MNIENGLGKSLTNFDGFKTLVDVKGVRMPSLIFIGLRVER